MLAGMRKTERVTVTLPKDIADDVRKAVENGDAESVSALVADVLVEWFRKENVQQFLADMASGGEPMTDEAREWARAVIRQTRGE